MKALRRVRHSMVWGDAFVVGIPEADIAPDISVIVPTFRRPAALEEAVRSALSQQGVTVEVTVLDDDPTGSAEAVIAGIADPRVSYIKMATPSGGRPALVRNAGMPSATAPLVHFLDDDDKVPEGHYARAKQAFAAHPTVGVVFGRIEPFGVDAAAVAEERGYFETAARRALAFRKFGTVWGFAAAMLFSNTLLVCSAGMIRRECVAALQGFDGSLALVEDVDFYARAMRRFGACFLDETVLHYRIGPSLMHQENVQPIIDGCYRSMFQRYRREWGPINFWLLKLFAKIFCR